VRQDPRLLLDEAHTLGPRGNGVEDRERNEPGAYDDDVYVRARQEGLGVVQRPQGEDRRMLGSRDGRTDRPGARRQQQPIERKGRSVVQAASPVRTACSSMLPARRYGSTMRE
jgi:hypothetical protein